MVDETRVLRLLRRLSDETDVLDAESHASLERRADPLWLRGVKYSFVVVIEVAVDVAQHTCASEGWGPPEDNGHAMRLLGERAVLERLTPFGCPARSGSATCSCTSTQRSTTTSSSSGWLTSRTSDRSSGPSGPGCCRAAESDPLAG